MTESRLWLLDDPRLPHFTSDCSFTASCHVLRLKVTTSYRSQVLRRRFVSLPIDSGSWYLAALQAVHRFSMVGIGRRSSSGVIGRLGSTICQSAHPGVALVLWCYVTVWLDFLCRFTRLTWQAVALSSTRFLFGLCEFGDGLLLVRARYVPSSSSASTSVMVISFEEFIGH